MSCCLKTTADQVKIKIQRRKKYKNKKSIQADKLETPFYNNNANSEVLINSTEKSETKKILKIIQIIKQKQTKNKEINEKNIRINTPSRRPSQFYKSKCPCKPKEKKSFKPQDNR